MGHLRIETSPLSTLDPEAVREVTHTVDGTRLRAVILEADSRRFKARMIEPFEMAFEKSLPGLVLMWTDGAFVRDGRLTNFFLQAFHQEMERCLHAWRQMERERQHFLAHRDVLEPRTRQAHLDAQGAIRDLEEDVQAMQSVGEALNAEFAELRRELRQRFKSGVIGQGDYQSRLKMLKDTWPKQVSGTGLLEKVDGLNHQFTTHRARLRDLVDAFAEQAGLGLAHAASLLELEALPLDGWLKRYPPARLKGLNRLVDSLFSVDS